MADHRKILVHSGFDKEKGAKRNGIASRQLIAEDKRGDINLLADVFIKNFHNQLKIQREESIKRYKEMIARGA
ncbi:conserved hypothetical protein [Ricinus communis]|uniref:Uncharacterized protein n=1 Tax=Ricinus communis TaxID=3988 RepID=B9SM35_RICCO|nr:conserved hypothetical protein [Ricinus communis]EEF35298.1 conserved hypothetical protein [Ricinus communis]EEF35300.1 conserved hypothetical protein [Ricinus communis]